MDLLTFRPRRAVQALSQKPEPDLAFARPWVLARLLAWCVLDQRAGKRKRPASRIRTRNAKRAGHLVLMSMLDAKISAKASGPELEPLVALFFQTGGFGACRDTP